MEDFLKKFSTANSLPYCKCIFFKMIIFYVERFIKGWAVAVGGKDGCQAWLLLIQITKLFVLVCWPLIGQCLIIIVTQFRICIKKLEGYWVNIRQI